MTAKGCSQRGINHPLRNLLCTHDPMSNDEPNDKFFIILIALVWGILIIGGILAYYFLG